MKTKKSDSPDFGVRLRNLRRESGLSLQDIVDKLNSEYGMHTNKGMISKYENGIHEPGAGTIYCLSGILNVSSDYLTGKSDEKNDYDKNSGSGAAAHILKVYTSISDSKTNIDEHLSVLIPKNMITGGREFFALKISGGRLAPRFLNGDILIIEKKRKFSKDAVCVIGAEGSNAVLCTVVKKRDGKFIKPLDPAVDAAFYSTAQIRSLPVTIFGEVIELRRKSV